MALFFDISESDLRQIMDSAGVELPQPLEGEVSVDDKLRAAALAEAESDLRELEASKVSSPALEHDKAVAAKRLQQLLDPTAGGTTQGAKAYGGNWISRRDRRLLLNWFIAFAMLGALFLGVIYCARDEKLHQLEMTLIASLTGLLGAVIGLIIGELTGQREMKKTIKKRFETNSKRSNPQGVSKKPTKTKKAGEKDGGQT
jgi:hypothetical protein